MFVPARLSEKQLAAIEKFEQSNGAKLVALTNIALEPVDLSEQALAKVRRLEQDTGLCLVAVK